MLFKTKIINGHELKYSSDWIHEIESKEQWGYYWNQARLVRSLFDKSDKIIEVGIGTGFLTNYLKSLCFNIVSLDIDADKNPDFIGEVSSFDYSRLDISIVLAFEIFEHIPLSLFKSTFNLFSENNILKVLFSVPSCQKSLVCWSLKVPRFKSFNYIWNVPSNRINTVAHHWELSSRKIGPKKSITMSDGKTLISRSYLTSILSEAGYSLKKLDQVDNINFFLATKS